MGKKIKLDAAADEPGISIRGVRQLISRGKLKAFRIGEHSVRIDVDDLAAVLKPIMPDGKD
jgi:helix-turn-helix protein